MGKTGIGSVLGPNGDVLTLADLPSNDTKRWVPRRKAEIIAAVSGGLITLSEVLSRYSISEEEYCGWADAYGRLGLEGLHALRREIPPCPEATL
jgi:hypothetical protein